VSVYQPKGTDRYVYDFVRKGRRYVGPCETTSLSEARRVERAKIAEVESGFGPDDVSELTIDAAAARWFDEVGQYLKSSQDLERSLDLVVMCIGPRTMLRDIDSAKVTAAMTARRAIPAEFRSSDGVKTRPVKAATVNRQVLDITRRILRRARLGWGAKNLPEIDWGSLRLGEGKKRHREIADDERAALRAAMRRDYWTDFREFLGTYGLRLSEMFFHPSRVAVIDKLVKIRIRERKDGSTYMITLLPEDGRKMLARKSRAEAAGLDTVWFRETGRRRRRKRPSLPAPPPELVALTYAAARSALRRAIDRSGVQDLRIHDHRHDVGTKLTRAAGIAIAQAQLGHSDIATTKRYVRVDDRDLLDALQAMKSRDESREADPSDGNSERKQGGVS
jgi:integrase